MEFEEFIKELENCGITVFEMDSDTVEVKSTSNINPINYLDRSKLLLLFNRIINIRK